MSLNRFGTMIPQKITQKRPGALRDNLFSRDATRVGENDRAEHIRDVSPVTVDFITESAISGARLNATRGRPYKMSQRPAMGNTGGIPVVECGTLFFAITA